MNRDGILELCRRRFARDLVGCWPDHVYEDAELETENVGALCNDNGAGADG